MKKLIIGIGSALILAAVAVTVCLQLYIFHYNRGNEFYELGQHEKAASEYEKALKLYVPEGRECDIRVNYALSMCAGLNLNDLTGLTEEEKTAMINTLETAIDILVEEECAHRNDDNGHDEEAQKLKNELQEIIDILKQEQNQPQNPDEDEEETNQPEKDELSEEQQQLQEIMQQGTDEHAAGMEEMEMYDGYSYYNGQCW